MTVLKSAGPWLVSLVLAFGLVPGGVGIGPTPATAGPDLWTEVVAPYVHLPVAIAPATGPLSTIFLIRSPKAALVPVQVQCFNNFSQFVGPSPQPAFVDLAPLQTFMLTPDDLTSNPNFTGVGWCYFSSADKFSVDVAWGLYGGPRGTTGFDGLPDFTDMRMFSLNSSVGVAVAVGQATVAGGGQAITGAPIPGVGNVPLWVGGNWVDVLVLVNPTASSGSVSVDVFNCAGCSPMPAPTTVPVPLPARGMGLVFLSNFAGAFPNGNATISSGATCCFVGWHWAINPTTRQAMFREVSLDRGTTRFLLPADRP
jgi:hypothetical protein